MSTLYHGERHYERNSTTCIIKEFEFEQEWCDMSKNPTKHVGLEQSKPHHHFIEN
jgi:hypothetical protein